jgi:MoaA/NifB/PqqE/SkfB family radical SAM enzyme
MIVVWRITTRCNLGCPFCAYDRRLPFARRTADFAHVRAFLPVLAAYQTLHRDPVLVSWLGGEPLREPALPALSAEARALGLRVSATTNGTTLAAEAVRRHILDNYAELTVSLDSPDAVHDALRSSPGLFSALRRDVPLLAAARRASTRPLKLRVNAVLLRTTIADFSRLAHEVAGWGVEELTFNLLGGRDRPEFFAAHRPTSDQFAKFRASLPGLRAELAPRLTIAGSPAYLARLQDAAKDRPSPVLDCAPGQRHLFIDEHGLVAPCAFTPADLGVPLAELQTPNAIADLPARFARRRVSHRPRVCADCPSTQLFEKFTPAAV